MTLVYRQFLADLADSYTADASNLWKEGRFPPDISEQLRGRVLQVEELRDLTHSAIAVFYGLSANTPDET